MEWCYNGDGDDGVMAGCQEYVMFWLGSGLSVRGWWCFRLLFMWLLGRCDLAMDHVAMNL